MFVPLISGTVDSIVRSFVDSSLELSAFEASFAVVDSIGPILKENEQV